MRKEKSGGNGKVRVRRIKKIGLSILIKEYKKIF
jgi:hypothetical protein